MAEIGQGMIFPGFIDVHVHFRDPGMVCAEDTESGLAAAKAGGIAAVVTMPNTVPACDSSEALRRQYDISSGFAERLKLHGGGPAPVLLAAACITRNREGRKVSDLEALAESGAAFFTDDGNYVSDDKIMEEAMCRAAKLGMCVCQHALDPRLAAGGVMRDCAFARGNALPTVPVAAETEAIRRDLLLCRNTGCRLHIQHISTAAGVELIRDAQKEGLPVTAEATPHHLVLSCEDIVADDANWKMSPPLGNREDRAELRRAARDGVLMFATDHAPHPLEKKNTGFLRSANGIIGLETAVALTWLAMVEEEGMSPESWAEAWWKLPRAILSRSALSAVECLPRTKVSGESWRVDPERFVSRSRNMPYSGMELPVKASLEVR